MLRRLQTPACRSIAEIPEAIQQTIASIQSLHVLFLQLPPKSSKSLTLNIESEGQQITYRFRFLIH
jgi:uncharacterized protein YdeI (YjbR/CyaY-like superfamily)